MAQRTTTRSSNGHMPAPLSLALNQDALRPLISEIVAEVLAQVEADRVKLGTKLCYSEPQAAALLDLKASQLKAERLNGRIACCKLRGRRLRYEHCELMRYLADRRVKREG